jgi:N-acetylmuramoyl-L-alanine amidase
VTTEEARTLLAKMRLDDHATRSRHFAELMQRAILSSVHLDYGRAKDGGVHAAMFSVLVGARMPGVLLESSYISHPEEELWLGEETYRQRIADGIANAVKAFRLGR